MSRRFVADELEVWCRQCPRVALDQVVVGVDPVEELLGRSTVAQMLVVGSRGLNGLQSLVLGSVSHALLHRIGCPPAVVRAPGEPDMP